MKRQFFLIGLCVALGLLILGGVVSASGTIDQNSNTGWRQSNSNGFQFTDNNTISAVKPYNNYLYAGTVNSITGGQIWRTNDGSNWNNIVMDGFGYSYNSYIDDLAEFDGYSRQHWGRDHDRRR